MNKMILIAMASGLVAATGCGAARPEGAAPADASAAGEQSGTAQNGPAPANFTEQVALGQRLYGAKCASCHGSSGEGTGDAPRVVGLKDGALPLEPPADRKFRKSEFKTVMDVGAFVVANMPPNQGGSLSTEEYFSILAFDLKANGIDLGDKKLDAELAKTLVIPR